jgi:hypothetical protein
MIKRYASTEVEVLDAIRILVVKGKVIPVLNYAPRHDGGFLTSVPDGGKWSAALQSGKDRIGG